MSFEKARENRCLQSWPKNGKFFCWHNWKVCGEVGPDWDITVGSRIPCCCTKCGKYKEVPSNGITFHRFSDTDSEPNPCFPYGCGGISGPFTNPNPRKENEKPACYYGPDGVLFYEKAGKSCSYIRRFNSHEIRVERRKQEWFRSHSE